MSTLTQVKEKIYLLNGQVRYLFHVARPKRFGRPKLVSNGAGDFERYHCLCCSCSGHWICQVEEILNVVFITNKDFRK